MTKDGDAAALPRLGLFQWENTIPAPNQTDTTWSWAWRMDPRAMSASCGSTPGQAESGEPVAKAGLTNGDDHVLDAVDQAVSTDTQWRATYDVGEAAPVRSSTTNGTRPAPARMPTALRDGLSLNRIEDGYFDPNNPNDFYFLTTEGGQNNGESPSGPLYRDGGGLWLLRWADLENPNLGGTLTLLLDGSEEIGEGEAKMHKPDNMAIDTHGNLLIQEDPGNVNHLARIVAYRIRMGHSAWSQGSTRSFWDRRNHRSQPLHDRRGVERDHRRRGVPRRWAFIFDAQIHTTKHLPAGTGPGTVQEFVENGQLLTLKVDDWAESTGTDPRAAWGPPQCPQRTRIGEARSSSVVNGPLTARKAAVDAASRV